MATEASKVYMHLKNGGTKYAEKKHCEMILKNMGDEAKGTVSAFCVEAKISDSTFYNWCNRYKIFNECYRLGIMMSRENWESQGRVGKDYEPGEWNIEYWRMIGWSRFGVGKNSRIRLDLKKGGTPNDHYSQLIEQASNGDFTAGEIKQLMEAINIGLRSHEVFELQKQIDDLILNQAQLEKARNGDNISSDKGA